MADISQLRLREKLRINEEIRLNQKYNELDSATLARFRSVTADKYALTQTEKLTAKVNERTLELESLTKRLNTLESGELDEELLLAVKNNTQVAKEKHSEYIQAKIDKKKLEEEDSAMSKKYYDKERQGDKLNKEYYYKGALRHFDKAQESLPDWMKSELTNMPNNEGVVWKSVHFYGMKPPNNHPYTQVTEYKKGLKVIHRWDNNTMSIYEKKGGGREVLVSQEMRRKVG